MSHRTVDVRLAERSYPIHIGTGLLAQSHEWIARHCPATHAVLIADEHVQPFAGAVAKALRGASLRVDRLEVPSGETSKSVAQADRLWNAMLSCHADRRSLVIAVGGGVTGDLAGFVAATFARGLNLVQVPTTLLAQVDSSVGGKVGINLPHAKNMVGTFWQPRLVLIDPTTLTTLPEREYRSGLAEVVKYGVIMAPEFFGRLEEQAGALMDRQAEILMEVVATCCRLKADVVEEDEREVTGLRAILNYGHTFAHGLEATTGYQQLLHGEAVAIGMMCAARLARLLGRIDAQLVERQRDLLARLGLPWHLPAIDVDRVLSAMAHDKKTEHGKLRFVLPTRLGSVELVQDVDLEHVRVVLEERDGS